MLKDNGDAEVGKGCRRCAQATSGLILFWTHWPSGLLAELQGDHPTRRLSLVVLIRSDRAVFRNLRGRGATLFTRDDYYLPADSTVQPRVYLRLTEKWIVLSLRYASGVYRGRELEDAMSRQILEGLMRGRQFTALP